MSCGLSKDRLEAGFANRLALGCWAFGGKGWGGQSGEESLKVMECALEHGIRHFDTARSYGVSEELVGKFLKGRRDSVFLASKVFPGSDPASVRKGLEESLKRLQVDWIDLYYLHWPREGLPIGPQLEALAQAREDGLIGAIGVCNYSLQQLQAAAEGVDLDFLQSGYHLLWRQLESEIIPYCKEADIRVISYSSLGQGILTGKFPTEVRFPKGDHRKNVLHFREDVWPHVHAAVEQLQLVAKRAGRPLTHLALQWLANRGGVAAVLVGARNLNQINENAQALQDPVAPEILEEMTAISDALKPHLPDADNIFGAHL